MRCFTILLLASLLCSLELTCIRTSSLQLRAPTSRSHPPTFSSVSSSADSNFTIVADFQTFYIVNYSIPLYFQVFYPTKTIIGKASDSLSVELSRVDETGNVITFGVVQTTPDATGWWWGAVNINSFAAPVIGSGDYNLTASLLLADGTALVESCIVSALPAPYSPNGDYNSVTGISSSSTTVSQSDTINVTVTFASADTDAFLYWVIENKDNIIVSYDAFHERSYSLGNTTETDPISIPNNAEPGNYTLYAALNPDIAPLDPKKYALAYAALPLTVVNKINREDVVME